MLIRLKRVLEHNSWIGNWHTAAGCQFANSCELATDNWQSDASLMSDLENNRWIGNWQKSTSCQFVSPCQLPIQLLCSKTFSNRIGIWLPVTNSPGLTNWHKLPLPVAYSPDILYNCLKSNSCASCQLPVHKNLRIGIWRPFASCLFSFISLNPSQIELSSDCRLPFVNSLGLTKWRLAAFCRLPIHQLFSVIVSNRIGIWLPVASWQFT